MYTLRTNPTASFAASRAVPRASVRPAVRLAASSSRSSLDRIDDLLSEEQLKRAVDVQVKVSKSKDAEMAPPATSSNAAAPAEAAKPASPTAPAKVMPDGTLVFSAEQLKKVAYNAVKL